MKDYYYTLSTMKYRIGDKVKIKTWKEMEKEYGVSSLGWVGYINCLGPYKKEMEDVLNRVFPDRILTISGIYGLFYSIKGIGRSWHDEMIECLVEDYKEPVPITSRWELLDL